LDFTVKGSKREIQRGKTQTFKTEKGGEKKRKNKGSLSIVLEGEEMNTKLRLDLGKKKLKNKEGTRPREGPWPK